MPIGSYAAIPLLTRTLLARRPRSVLDLGMGFGGLGVAVREWLDLGVQPWNTWLAGVEAWPQYSNPVWDLYNVVHVQSIEEFLPGCTETFDCVLLGDVLEHFDKPAGEQLIAAIQPRVAEGGCLVIVTPARFVAQGAVYGNERERHRSVWSEAEFAERGFDVTRAGNVEDVCGECLFAQWTRP